MPPLPLPRLYLDRSAERDALIALEFGRVEEGQPPERWRPVGPRFAYLLEAPGGRAVGFTLADATRFAPDAPELAEIWSGPRFDVPVLGLSDVSAGEVALAARATFGTASTVNRSLRARAEGAEGEDALGWWLACLQAGDATAHLGLGRCLYELGRHTDAYRHLRHYAEIAPHDAGHWSWVGRAAEALGDAEEAARAYRRAVALEEGTGAPTHARTDLAGPAGATAEPRLGRRALWGEASPVLGERRVEAIGARLGLGLTAGAVKKRTGRLDANEDVVAAVAGPRATLLVCADGHNGATSSRVAVEHVLAAFGEDPPPADVSDAELVELWHAVNGAVVAAAASGRQPDSATTLVLALVAGSRVQWAALGDSMLAVVRGGGLVRRLDSPQRVFVGWPLTHAEVAQRVRRGTVELDGEDWVILATDGFVDFARPTAREAILDGVAVAADAADLAARLIDVACRGGAGDNVAVAALQVAPVPAARRPEPDPGRGLPARERLRGAERHAPRGPGVRRSAP